MAQHNETKTKFSYDLPVVVSVGRQGTTRHWHISVHVINGETNKRVPIDDEWYEQGSTLPPFHYGVYQVEKWTGTNPPQSATPTIIKKGKNIGKSSETNPFTQALSEARSLRDKHITRNAVHKRRAGTDLYPPMLATKYKGFPTYSEKLYQQPKYDGVRAVITLGTNNEIIVYSRGLKEYKKFDYFHSEARRLLNKLEEVLGGDKVYLDGELYKHGEDLQDISGSARNTTKSIQLEYFCYDCFVPSQASMTYRQRKDLLDQTFSCTDTDWIRAVPTWEPHTEDDIKQHHARCLDDGFEGSMLRLDRPYSYSYKGYHSKHLLKIKPKLDAEFPINGFFEAKKGKARGCLMWQCTTADGSKTFNVTPKGSLEDRKKMFRYLSQTLTNGRSRFDDVFLGKMLTVSFDAYSKDKVPLRASAVAIRDYE